MRALVICFLLIASTPFQSCKKADLSKEDPIVGTWQYRGIDVWNGYVGTHNYQAPEYSMSISISHNSKIAFWRDGEKICSCKILEPYTPCHNCTLSLSKHCHDSIGTYLDFRLSEIGDTLWLIENETPPSDYLIGKERYFTKTK